ncbi:CDP-diacylglycerol-inositol 3-phosphatidyltransferase isoform 1 phosphatidylinositol synthase ns synthase PI synthase [Cryptosporidium sp. chipmunk genotype I]|uniref:CDP-diacylglycerol-inositol 3-phosphatidyltransferase isoform 1 phosphatidylinositol synthase ns synthase PI synthase n=1 Tax=Cryptosporidium sp. chipmunk genotype I TaxID=1280935 RepID=UPI00351A77A4|nr:CDP-diacylglycerol-inositol 3-phosphatidyltransferase isoform 1 phosphatidylinositol synthase ns synthase PI synthase [Cryptosporidium sp. chipmunk genotype I]
MKITKKSILLYVPNLIGYLRILLGLTPLIINTEYYYISIIFYGISQILDAFDGHFARLLMQETKFGAMLDMITDRCSTVIIIILTITLNRNYTSLIILFLIGDISGHWLYMISSILSKKSSHKSIKKDMWPILKLYYSNKPLLFTLHTCNEALWLILYAQGCIYNKFTNLKQLNQIDQRFMLSTPYALYIILPLALMKNILNFVHLFYGCNILLDIDIREKTKN